MTTALVFVLLVDFLWLVMACTVNENIYWLSILDQGHS